MLTQPRLRHLKSTSVSPEAQGSPAISRSTKLSRTFTRYKFGLAAFLIPLGIRAIPEIIVGPYPVGWDTIAFYVPNTLDWATGRLGWVALLGTAPLLYMISVPVYLVTRVNPVWIFKIMGPILYGGMILALYRFLRLGLKWTEKMSLGAGLMTSLYFVTLRISWDLYRNMLGLTFILISLPLLQERKGSKGDLILSVLLLLAVASDQLIGVLAITLIGARFLFSLRKGQHENMVRLVMLGLAPVILFATILYAGLVQGLGLVETQSVIPGVGALGSSVGFLGYAFLPILPLAVIGIRRLTDFDLKVWAAFCTVSVLVALLPLYGWSVESYRFALLLDLPVCVYAALGLSRLKDIAVSASSRIGRVMARGVPLIPALLLLSAVLYIALPAQQAMAYYTTYPSFVPTSMIQDSVPASDMGSLSRALGWVTIHMGQQDVLITHQAIYGWARAYLAPTAHVIDYNYSDPMRGVQRAQSLGYSTIWTIWWTPGLGWHGQAYLPNNFAIVFQNGDMAVYEYQ
jgi:hypothetical protein